MNIYILVSSESISGGPELAHQMCNEINKNPGYKGKMCYVDTEAKLSECLPVDRACPKQYEKYETEHAVTIEEIDQDENLVIIPEGLTRSHELFHKAKIIIWWMSVDNYFVSTNGRNLHELQQHSLLWAVQSYYAYEFCKKHYENSRIVFLSDYINSEHGKFLFPAEYRKDYALYNPSKGYDELKPLIEKANWLQWIPLCNLSLEETILMMQSSKIYVDFGNHPGKDRIPREAAVNGCCVITNKKGSAAYTEDVPIPEMYKFEDPGSSMNEIDVLMHDICSHFQTHQDSFSSYRKWIHEEKQRFQEEVRTLLRSLS